MKEYTIRKKADWDCIPELEISENAQELQTDIKAFCKICYDSENLYVRLRAEEEHIRAVNTSLPSEPCEDSCLEFFFSPDNCSEKYFNIEYNPNCFMYLGIGSNIKNLFRLIPEDMTAYSFNPKVEYIPGGWRITYQVPFRFIRLFFPNFSPKSGDYIMANAYATGDLCEVPHNLSWNPVDPSVQNSFHNPKVFGKMFFE